MERTAPSFAFEDEIIRLVGRFPSAPQLTAPVPGLGTTNTSEARGRLLLPPWRMTAASHRAMTDAQCEAWAPQVNGRSSLS